jgi:hypothetical protein
MTAKFAGTCIRCHQKFPAGAEIIWKKGIGATHPEGTCTATPVPEPEGDLKKVVDHLYDRSRKGTLNEFTQSLLNQWERKGQLSPKQQDVILRRLKDDGEKVALPLLPSGRYAVTVNSETLLIHVWHPKGKPEVQRLYEVKSHSDSGQKLWGAAEMAAATAIAKDPAQAAIDYGHRTKHCYRCGSGLENNLSKSMGVGPVCVKHVMENEPRLAMMAAHRAHIRSHGFEPDGKLDPVPPFGT